MTRYRFWGGLDTIGGNIVEILTGQARVICDFGLSFSGEAANHPDGMPLTEQLIIDGSLPAIPGLYDTEGFRSDAAGTVHEKMPQTAIFISHLHLDHMGGLPHLPEGTNVYLSKEAYRLYSILVEAGEEQPARVSLSPVGDNETVTVGDIRVTFKASDHDTPGSSALFIETDDMKLIHSGDLRLTGNRPENVISWVKEAERWQPDVLMLEGTSYSSDRTDNQSASPATEKELIKSLETLLRDETEAIVFINPYIRNIERMKDVAEAAERSGRMMVFEEPYARVLKTFHPDLQLAVLKETVIGDAISEKTIPLHELSEHPGRFVLQNSYPNIRFVEEFDWGIYCHSNGEPLGTYDPRYADMLARLEKHHFRFTEMGTSGHAGQMDLIAIAEVIGAGVTVPWHTLRPQVFHQELQLADVPTFLPKAQVWYGKETAEKEAELPVHTR
ncbi:Ribonuclease J 1 [Bhargavaea cecembensis DSE10]|uniref:Ribonuclease J 1 n=1 Tax=Bhargavaea cecembensis DSE10 TaxID=1235279 RepID=M7NJL6_9BACL|nr:MBL fold metallo-hydrolase [Bhargavaea cecembensis]EMR07326.1 Ribonuclease J 1 [Bhargavaea cecembensis DSE10]